jgi:hypothetical protein
VPLPDGLAQGIATWGCGDCACAAYLDTTIVASETDKAAAPWPSSISWV